MKRFVRWAVRVLLVILGLIAIGGFVGWCTAVHMPGDSHVGALPALGERETKHQAELQRHVQHLAGELGERNDKHPDALRAAADYIEAELKRPGYEVSRQPVPTYEASFDNLEVAIAGTKSPDEIVVIGAHYDSAEDAPGANDNGTGTAALLVLAEAFAKKKPGRTLRFVAFTNEEPPHFKTERMGSLIYARRCKERNEKIVAMLSLETMGFYDDSEGTQKYPAPLSAFYPSQGNFIAVVGDVGSRELVHEVIGSFRRHAKFPSEGGALPGSLPGISWSDHWSFWEQGYQGVMLTDTAPFRYHDYHEPSDTPDKVDYARLARVVAGLEPVIAELALVGD